MFYINRDNALLGNSKGKFEMPKWSNQYSELGATISCSIRATTTIENVVKT
jgi:hypothetical protein